MVPRWSAREMQMTKFSVSSEAIVSDDASFINGRKVTIKDVLVYEGRAIYTIEYRTPSGSWTSSVREDQLEAAA